MKAWFRRNWVSVATWIFIIAGWQIASGLVPKPGLVGSPIVPSIQFIFTSALKSISGSWTLHFWAPNPEFGGAETYLGAILALVYNTMCSLYRVLLGLAVGLIAGVGSGLIISYSTVARRIIWGPINFLRMVPLLSAIPLFAYWFGANSFGTTVIITISVLVLLVVTTFTAVANVPKHYVESARTLGASRFQAYLYVIVPRALPELRTGLLLAAGLSWSMGVGAEYLGLQTGLGAIMATAVDQANTGRMIIVAIDIMVCSLITFWGLNKLFNRAVHWMPQSRSASSQVGAGVAAAAGGRAINAGATLSTDVA